MMKCQDNISQSEQTALEIMENPAAISTEQLLQMQSDEQCLELCRTMMDIEDAGVDMPDADAELERFHQLHPRRRSRHIVLVAALAVAASAALFFLLRPTHDALRTETANPLLVFKAAQPKDDHATLQISREKRQLDLNAKPGSIPSSISNLNAHEIVYVSDKRLADILKSGEIATHQVRIPGRETFRIVLADGSEVFLNAGSRLVYPERFAGDKRTVYLEGEAYFKVAKDNGRPFVVESRQLQTQVLGTEFDMRAYVGEPSSVALLEGSVEVSSTATRTSRKIRPGERAQLDAKGNMNVQEVDVDQYRYWKDGYFYFDQCSIETIMKEIGRWYNVDVEFRTHRISQTNLHFAGDRNKPLDYTLRLINQMEKVKVSFENGKIMID